VPEQQGPIWRVDGAAKGATRPAAAAQAPASGAAPRSSGAAFEWLIVFVSRAFTFWIACLLENLRWNFTRRPNKQRFSSQLSYSRGLR